jgi:hypothetical protein
MRRIHWKVDPCFLALVFSQFLPVHRAVHDQGLFKLVITAPLDEVCSVLVVSI